MWTPRWRHRRSEASRSQSVREMSVRPPASGDAGFFSSRLLFKWPSPAACLANLRLMRAEDGDVVRRSNRALTVRGEQNDPDYQCKCRRVNDSRRQCKERRPCSVFVGDTCRHSVVKVTPDVAECDSLTLLGFVHWRAASAITRRNCAQLIGRGAYNRQGIQSPLQQRNASKRSESMLQLHRCGDLRVVSRLPAARIGLPGNWIIGF